MATQVIILATDSGDSEDGRVHYSDYLLVSSDTLKFDEPIFKEDALTAKQFPGADAADELEDYDESEDPNGWGAPYVSRSKFVEHLRNLGYTVEDANINIYWAPGYDK